MKRFFLFPMFAFGCGLTQGGPNTVPSDPPVSNPTDTVATSDPGFRQETLLDTDSGQVAPDDGGPVFIEDSGTVLPPDDALCSANVKRTCEQSRECCLKGCTNAAGVCTVTCVDLCVTAYNSCVHERCQSDPGYGK